MAPQANPSAGRRPLPRATIVRAVVLVAVLAIGFVLIRFTPVADLLTEEKVVAAFEVLRRSWWAPLFLIALYLLTSPLGIPVSPYMLAAGAVFGFVAGSIYNMVGLVLGAAASYYLARALGRDFVVYVTRGRLRRVERIFERSGFWPLVQSRFMPIPFALVNFGAALAGVKAPFFLTASFVGLVPATLVHTYFMAAVFAASGAERWWTVVQYLSVLVAFNVVISYPSIRRGWGRRRRFKKLVASRRRRAKGGGAGSSS